ncbi:MAG: hypothetical protein N2169_06495 [bacterium]|nr:hypothetical protein [bacterium]
MFEENYITDIITPEITKDKIFKYEYMEDYDQDTISDKLFDEIIIYNIDGMVQYVINLDKEYGGLPRLNRKGEFRESKIEIIGKRYSIYNNKKSIVYYCKDKAYQLSFYNEMIRVYPRNKVLGIEDRFKEILYVNCDLLDLKSRLRDKLRYKVDKIRKRFNKRYR